MKMNVTRNTITVRSSRWVFFLFSIMGIISLATGIIMRGKIVLIDHVMIGFGIIFFAAGVIFLMRAKNYRIEINPETGGITISEGRGNKGIPVELPSHYLSGILIQRNITQGQHGKNRTYRYEISLVSDLGSTLHIADFTNNEKAVECGRELQDILKVDLISDDELIRRLLSKRAGNADMDVNPELPEHSGIRVMKEGDTMMLSWNCRNALAQHLFLVLVIYGFFHLIHFAAGATVGNAVISVLLYCIVGIMGIIALSIIIMNAAGTYSLAVSDTTIRYYIMIFGKKITSRSLDKTGIGMIKNSIGGQDDSIQVLSTKGLELVRDAMNRFMQETSPMPDLSLVNVIYSLKDEMLNINVSSLSISEKWYIESLLLRQRVITS